MSDLQTLNLDDLQPFYPDAPRPQAGDVQAVEVLCSHYFAAADSDVYQHMAALAKKHDFRLAALRSHAKLLLFAIGKRRIVVESSANLRSCSNVEQATLFDDPSIYKFHRDWVLELLGDER
jgi:hypothetical protein